MRPRLVPLLGIAVWLGANPVFAQAIKSPADILPAKTVVYAELKQPGALAKEIAALLKGSYLENVPESLAPLTAKFPMAGARLGPEPATWFSMAGAMFGPEVVNEISRLKGGAFAITGMDKEFRDIPEYIAIILPGESNIPGFAMRMAMSAAMGYGSSGSDGKTQFIERSGFERVEAVEGIGVYRMIRRSTVIDLKTGKAETKERAERDTPSLAMMPDALLIGTHSLVKDVIRRAKGKGDGASLASLETFKKASKDMGDKPCLFAFADVGAAMAFVDSLELDRDARAAVAVVKKLVNPKAFLAVADQLALDKGTLEYHRRIYLDPKEKSPALDLLPTSGIPRSLLHYIPPDSVGFAALSNDSGAKRFRQIIDLADEIFRATGARGPTPSEEIAQMEKKLEIDFAKLAGDIRAAAIALPGLKALADDHHHKPPFCLLIEAADAKAASALTDETLPKVFAIIAREKVEPKQKKIDGHTVNILETKGGYALVYARDGKALIVSPNPSMVTGALSQAKTKGILGDAKFAKRLDELKDPIVVGAVRPITLLGFFLLARGSAPDEPKFDKGPEPKLEKRPDGAKAIEEAKIAIGVAGKGKDGPKAGKGPDAEMKAILELLKGEEPLLLGLSRTPEQLSVDATYPGLRTMVPRLVNFGLEQAYRGWAMDRRPPPFKKEPVPDKEK